MEKVSNQLDQTCAKKRNWKDLFSFRRPKFENTAARDWMILFFLSLFLLFVILFWSGYIFHQTFFLQDQPSSLLVGERNTTVNEAKLERVIRRFEEKETTFENLLKNPPAVVDPSK
ncbi:MAG TPA: hypothetical protein VFM02_04330 [Candidatus Paceibacterota bacterium]|nr:hypothetical protein [Candidatus Paceibacterota bacterium]